MADWRLEAEEYDATLDTDDESTRCTKGPTVAERYTPTTEEVRLTYWVGRRWVGIEEANAEFDDWQAADRAETRRRALNEAADAIYANLDAADETYWSEFVRALAEKGADHGASKWDDKSTVPRPVRVVIHDFNPAARAEQLVRKDLQLLRAIGSPW